MDDVTEVTPHLYVCGQMAINDKILRRLEITVIVNAAKELENYVTFSDDIELTTVKIPVRDGAVPLYPYFEVSYLYW